ncbi:hypothetical protein GGF43_002761 [Coemansia sp. RSA 2618]|nr:hypothetical protein GGF43_002761 [Coemansia sp. RSA 2618]
MQALLRAPWARLGRRVAAGTSSIQRCTRIHFALIHTTTDQAAAKANAVSTTTDQAAAKANDVATTTGQTAADLREVGRRRAAASTHAARVSRYTRQHRGRLRIRQALLDELESEFQGEAHGMAQEPDDAPVHRHILIRDLMAALRRLGHVEFAEADGVCEGTHESAAVVAAWDQYRKIAAHPDAAALLTQVPTATVSLLICELNFMRAPRDYRRRFEHIVLIWSDYEALGRPPESAVVFSMYLRALNMLGKHHSVLNKVAELYLQGDKPPVLPVSVMRQVISAYFAGNRPAKAMELFHEMTGSQEYCGKVTPHIYTTVLRGALKTRCLANSELYIIVEELLELLAQPAYDQGQRTGVLNEILQTSHMHGNSGLLFYAFERFLAHGFAINSTTFGILLRSSCTGETDAREIHALYRCLVESESTRAQMSDRVFATFIAAFVRAQRADYALSVVQDMRAHPCWQRSAWHFEPLFGYYAENAMAQQALELYRLVVGQDGLQPTWRICTAVVSAISWGGRLPQAHDTQAAETNIRDADIDTLLTMAGVCGSTGDVRRILAVISELCARNPRDLLAFAAIVLKTHQLISTYAERISSGFRFGPSFSGIRTDAELHQLTARLRAALDRLFAQGVHVPQDLYHHAMSAFVLARTPDHAQHTYDHMTLQMSPTSQTFNILLRSSALGIGAAAALDVFENVRERGLPLHCVSANVLIHGLFDAQRPLDALAVYAYLVGRPTPLVEHARFSEFLVATSCDVYTFALLVRGLVRAAMVKEAAVVFEDAFSVLPLVPRQLLETLVGALEEMRMFDVALVFLKRFSKRVESVQPDDARHYAASAEDVAPSRLPLSHFGYLFSKLPEPG